MFADTMSPLPSGSHDHKIPTPAYYTPTPRQRQIPTRKKNTELQFKPYTYVPELYSPRRNKTPPPMEKLLRLQPKSKNSCKRKGSFIKPVDAYRTPSRESLPTPIAIPIVESSPELSTASSPESSPVSSPMARSSPGLRNLLNTPTTSPVTNSELVDVTTLAAPQLLGSPFKPYSGTFKRFKHLRSKMSDSTISPHWNATENKPLLSEMEKLLIRRAPITIIDESIYTHKKYQEKINEVVSFIGELKNALDKSIGVIYQYSVQKKLNSMEVTEILERNENETSLMKKDIETLKRKVEDLNLLIIEKDKEIASLKQILR